jgi:uncharacterized protein (TIRG00374 family)
LYKLAGILVSVLFVYLAVRDVDLSEFLRALGTTQFGWLLAATPIYLCSFPVRALRWRRILLDQKVLSFREVMVPTVIGHMANNILPARTGEIYRAHFLGSQARMSRSGVMGSIVAERIFDVLMLVSLLLLLFILYPKIPFIGGVASVFGLVFLALATGALIYSLTADRLHRAVDKVLRVLPQNFVEFISRQLKSFLLGIRGISTVRGGLEVVAYTALIWALETCAVALVVISFGVKLPLSGYLLVYVLAALGTMLPSGPAYVGPYQYAFVLALGFFAVSQEVALASSIVAQLTLAGSITAIGLVLFWREQLHTGPPLRQEKVKLKKENID